MQGEQGCRCGDVPCLGIVGCRHIRPAVSVGQQQPDVRRVAPGLHQRPDEVAIQNCRDNSGEAPTTIDDRSRNTQAIRRAPVVGLGIKFQPSGTGLLARANEEFSCTKILANPVAPPRSSSTALSSSHSMPKRRAGDNDDCRHQASAGWATCACRLVLPSAPEGGQVLNGSIDCSMVSRTPAYAG
jgi:hypothetical protein